MKGLYSNVFSLLHIPHTSDVLEEIVRSAPYSGTLFGVSYVLSKYNVPSESVRFNHKSDIAGVGTVALVIFRGTLVVVESVDVDSIRLRKSDSEIIEIPFKEFEREWNGVALLVYLNENSGETDYVQNRRKQTLKRFKNLSLICCIAIIVSLGLILNPLGGSWAWWVLLALNAAGMAVAYMLLQKQLRIPSRIADKICSIAKESHCEDVTDSSGADFFGLAKLSEIGAAFFGVNLVALLLWPQSLYFLAIVSLCVLPFTLWSLWYQKFKAKSWCVLCLCTLAIMWMQACVYVIGGAFDLASHQWTTLLALVAAYCVVTILINRLMTLIDSNMQSRGWQRNFNTLKTQSNVVESYERQANKFDTGADECTSLIFGNPEADRRITVFSNPYCGPCALMHKRINHLPSHTVSVSYVMTHFSEEASLINRYIIAAYQQLGPKRAWEILDQWFDGGKSIGEKFFQGLKLDPFTSAVTAELDKHRRWRADDRLAGTPTVIINGREIQMPYTVEDYIYLSAS